MLKPVIEAMAGGTREPVGWFDYSVTADTWTWSPGLYEMHGFEPGEIVPTTAVFVAHKHPDDRAHTDQVLAAVLATGAPYCCRHRIVTSRREIRTVVTIGRGYLDGSGRVASVQGYFVDITAAAVHASRQELNEAVNRSSAARADIEQAKGALMMVQGVSADDAFAVLSWHASHGNMKLRDVATTITGGISRPLAPEETPEQRIGRLLHDIAPIVSDTLPRQAASVGQRSVEPGDPVEPGHPVEPREIGVGSWATNS
ncbi:PAS and ANTAR domain-containing protein [Nakamurella sp. UYEF19]|uniref:PAS and ANTAR domain-containing protein n=1 Tax=Nakamurella sp. UYEF19 TaxID=1756392 RepID=UPI0033943AE4